MCVCVCVCVCVYACVYIYIYIYGCVWVDGSVYECVCVPECMCVCVYAYPISSQKQDAVFKQSLTCLNLEFPSPRRITKSKLKSLVLRTIYP